MQKQAETKWVTLDLFTGLQTKKDASKVPPGACVGGQNVTFTDADRISVRKLGYENYPVSKVISTETVKIASIKTFRKRDGENVLVRNQASSLEFFDETTIGWVAIESGFTAGIEFGYTEANINTDQQSF